MAGSHTGWSFKARVVSAAALAMVAACKEKEPQKAPAVAASTQAQVAEAKSCCMGLNDCKGKGGCAVPESNACAGQNDCKGKGGCNMHCPK